MKNIFLIKNIKNFFSFGKDSYYYYFKSFYKNKFICINYRFFKKKFLLKIIKNNFLLFCFNKYILNEEILRRIRISFLKKKIIFVKNHTFFDKIEYLFFKKKKNKFINWFVKKSIIFKPFIKIFNKNYFFNIYDISNKYIFINRNFIRCIISKFIL